jgi:Dolichyl-phosphate-mannose-protein mannosyltransferase
VTLVIVTGAALARLAGLPQQPGGLYPDEAAEGVTAHRILEDPLGYHPLFVAEDAGREPLYAYVTAGAFAIAGESVATLRSVSAVIGVLAVLAIGLALRRFGAGAALAGMAWAGGSLWLLSVSRDGFRNILVPLAGALILAALVAWADRPTRVRAVLAGAAVGAGLWTYQPLKLAPLLAAIWLWQLARHQRSRYDALRRDLRAAIVGFLVVGGPMLFVAVTQPGNYFGRGAETSLANAGNSHEGLLTHVLRTLGQFTVVGDPNARHNVGGMPLLGWPLFALAVLGGVVAWRRRDDPAYRLVLLGVPVFLLPPLLATEGSSPHFLRNLGLAPYVAALVGIGAVSLGGAAARRLRPWAPALVTVALAAGFVAAGAQAAHAYFSRPVRDRYGPYSFALVALAAAADHGPRTAVIVDAYSAFDVEFLDAAHPPERVLPSRRITDLGRFDRVVAASRTELARALGPDAARRALPRAFDPHGTPVVFEVIPPWPTRQAPSLSGSHTAARMLITAPGR